MSQFRSLVFEGGGVKGIAYAGALEELEKRGIMGEVTRVAGTMHRASALPSSVCWMPKLRC